jgi:LmbE family N-acetylglucosaminyl deacetylase
LNSPLYFYRLEAENQVSILIKGEKMKKLISLILLNMVVGLLFAQPKVPVHEWKDKTIMFIGAHPDDDARSHGTMAMLKDHGNEIYVVIITSGNVGTKDLNISMNQLSRIRKEEEINALAEIGITKEYYINLGYIDGMLELENKKEVIEKLVRLIRKYKPEIVMTFDPGKGTIEPQAC